MRVLLIEDDQPISKNIEIALTTEGYQVHTCCDGEDGLQHARAGCYDILIIDLLLPKIDGLNVIDQLRKQHIETPILILSAKKTVAERVAGLGVGGDDYLVKPFALAELIARVKALIRRSTSRVEQLRLTYSDLAIDLLSRAATRGGRKLDLRPREFLLLEYMMRNAEMVVTKTMILEHVWNYRFDPQTNIVDVLVCHLRNKVEAEGASRLIHTSRGVGYVLRQA
jgi:DNA-binding response OmpR family regulator